MAGALAAILDYEDNGCPVGMAGPVSWKGPGPLTLGENSPIRPGLLTSRLLHEPRGLVTSYSVRYRGGGSGKRPRTVTLRGWCVSCDR